MWHHVPAYGFVVILPATTNCFSSPKNKKKPPIRGLKVEMAGIEPASERLDSRISTSVAEDLFSFALRCSAQLPANHSLEPLGPLKGIPRINAQHSDFYDILAGFGQKNDSRGRDLINGGQLPIN